MKERETPKERKDPLEYPELREICWASNRWFNFYHGAVRSAKTDLSLQRFIAYVMHEKPAGDMIMTGYTATTLKRNVLDLILKLVGPKNFSYSLQSVMEARLFNNVIHLAGCDKITAVERLKGITASGGGYGDEIDSYPKDVFNFILTRIDSANGRYYATCNAGSPYHHLKTDWIDKAEERGIYERRFRLDDNPFLSKEYKDRMKAACSGARPCRRSRA